MHRADYSAARDSKTPHEVEAISKDDAFSTSSESLELIRKSHYGGQVSEQACAKIGRFTGLKYLAHKMKPEVKITNFSLYEDDGKDYTDPAQFTVLYPVEKESVYHGYLDMTTMQEYSNPYGVEKSKVSKESRWKQLLNQNILFLDLHSFHFLPAFSRPMDVTVMMVLRQILLSHRPQEIAMHLFYYDYVYLLENYDQEILPGVHSRLQSIVFDEATELKTFIFIRHNILKHIVGVSIASAQNTREGMDLLMIWIAVAFFLKADFKDYFSFRSIFMALVSEQLHSDKRMWNLLESENKAFFNLFEKHQRQFKPYRCIFDRNNLTCIYDLIPLVKFPRHSASFAFDGHDMAVDTSHDELANLDIILHNYSFDGKRLQIILDHCRNMVRRESLVPLLKEVFSTESLLKILIDPSLTMVPLPVEEFSKCCVKLDSLCEKLALESSSPPT